MKRMANIRQLYIIRYVPRTGASTALCTYSRVQDADDVDEKSGTRDYKQEGKVIH